MDVLIVLIISYVLLCKLRINYDDFAIKEAKRYFFDFNKIDNNWSANGKVYRVGIALIENKKTGKKEFIKQAELCDIGIL